MSDYEYTDTNGRLMKVKADRFAGDDRVLIQFHREAEGVFAEAARCIRPDDAPAVALAILEASGIEGAFYINTPSSNDPGGLLACATFLLRQAKNRRAERAEREAEDAKVRAWFHACWPGEFPTPDMPTVDDNMRRAFRASADFHARDEKPAPRVLNHGDPEPDRGTKWRDTDGDVWEWSDRCGAWTCDGATPPWRDIKAYWFPMTEVTR